MQPIAKGVAEGGVFGGVLEENVCNFRSEEREEELPIGFLLEEWLKGAT